MFSKQSFGIHKKHVYSVFMGPEQCRMGKKLYKPNSIGFYENLGENPLDTIMQQFHYFHVALLQLCTEDVIIYLILFKNQTTIIIYYVVLRTFSKKSLCSLFVCSYIFMDFQNLNKAKLRFSFGFFNK